MTNYFNELYATTKNHPNTIFIIKISKAIAHDASPVIGIVGAVGFMVSAFSNPFVAKMGFIKGVFTHLLAGAGTSIGGAIIAIPGAIGYSLVGAALMSPFCAAIAAKGEHLHAAKVGAALGLTFFGSGLVYGILGGGYEGYQLASQILNHVITPYKAPATETSARSIEAPIRLTMQNGRLGVTLSPKIAG